LTSLKISPIYTADIPITTKSIPVEKKIAEIILAHPVTAYPKNIDLRTTQIARPNETRESETPKPIENFNGLSEKDKIISDASLILFFKV
jgi:hypothetical protein